MAGRRYAPHPRYVGQHFLASDQLGYELVRIAHVTAADVVVEVGAGYGRLTAPLSTVAARVLAIEVDARLVRRLRVRFAGTPSVTVVHADVRHVGWPREPFRVVANLPFGVTTDLLRELLGAPARPLTAVDVIVQYGAAIKRTRPTGHALNIAWAPWWRLHLARRLSAECFHPPPTVDAALLVVRRRDPPLLPARESRRFARFVEAGFRRGWGRDAPATLWVSEYRRRNRRRR